MLPLCTLAWTVPNILADQTKPSASKTIEEETKKNRQNAHNISMFGVCHILTWSSYWQNLTQPLHVFGFLSQLQKETTVPIFWDRIEFEVFNCKAYFDATNWRYVKAGKIYNLTCTLYYCIVSREQGKSKRKTKQLFEKIQRKATFWPLKRTVA